MKLEQQVISLELAQKLKSLGVKQESVWWWYMGELYRDNPNYKSHAVYSAFTVAELGEMLPKTLNENGLDYELCCFYQNHLWCVMYMRIIQGGKNGGAERMDNVEIEEADTEADARAKMLIYLLENKYIVV